MKITLCHQANNLRNTTLKLLLTHSMVNK